MAPRHPLPQTLITFTAYCLHFCRLLWKKIPRCKHSFQQWPTLWDQSALRSICGQPQSSVRHFFSKDSLSKIKMWTDTLDRHHSAKINCEDTFRHLPKLKTAEWCLALPPSISHPLTRQVRSVNPMRNMADGNRSPVHCKLLQNTSIFGVSAHSHLSEMVLL